MALRSCQKCGAPAIADRIQYNGKTVPFCVVHIWDRDVRSAHMGKISEGYSGIAVINLGPCIRALNFLARRLAIRLFGRGSA
jgi:hypothetical protein